MMINYLKKWTKEESAVCRLERSQDQQDMDIRMIDLEQADQAHRFAGKSALLGRGTYGVVTLMRHKISGRLYAVKTLDKDVVLSTNMTSQVELELSAQQVMNHLNVVRCWNVEADENQINLIMDYCAHGDLFRRLRASKMRMIAEREVFRLFIQLVAGVNHIHSLGFCHRDLKLENLLLDDEMNLKIADFGWVTRVNGFQKNRNFCGTLDYLAPEMVTGAGHDWRIDNWGVGVLLYELSRGKPPFISTAHYDLLRRILDVDIHDDEEAQKREYVCTRVCGAQKCGPNCPALEELIQRPRLRGLAPDCLDVVKHFLRKDPNTRIELAEVLDMPWFLRMLREEYSRYLRQIVPPSAETPPPPTRAIESTGETAEISEVSSRSHLSQLPQTDDTSDESDQQEKEERDEQQHELTHHERLSIRRQAAQQIKKHNGPREESSMDADRTYVVESESTPDNDDTLSSSTAELTENHALSEEEPQAIAAPVTFGGPRALAWRSLTNTHPRESLEKILINLGPNAVSRVNIAPEPQQQQPTQPARVYKSSPRGVAAPQRAVSLSCANHNSIRSQSIFPPPLQRRYTGVLRANDGGNLPGPANSPQDARCSNRSTRQVMSNSSNPSWTLVGGGSDGVMSSEDLSDKQQQICTPSSRLLCWNAPLLGKTARPVMSVRPLFH